MNIVFASPLQVRNLDKHRWEITSPFRVQVDDVTHVVPTGFVTDFTSVPRLPLMYMIAGGRGYKSSALHDYMYSIRAGRDYADAVFRACLREEGHNALVSQLMYLGVRFGGRWRYREYHLIKLG